MTTKKRITRDEIHLEAPSRRCLEPEIGALLSTYLVGELAKDMTRKFENHLRECPRCMADKIRVNAALRILEENPTKFFADPKPIRTQQPGH